MLNKKILMLVFVMAFIFLVGCLTPLVPAKLIGIEVSPDKITMSVGATKQLEVTGFFDDGNHADITSDCIYSSSDSFIVIVNTKTGKVLGMGPGKAFIIIVDCFEGLFSDTVEVTVREDIVEEPPIKIIR